LVVRVDRKMQIAWRAWLAERGTMQRLERPSEAEIADRARGYFRWRLEEAIGLLPLSSQKLAEVLNEMYALLLGEDEIQSWRPVALGDARRRIGEPLIASKMETNAAER
jgi:hypothetical protein